MLILHAAKGICYMAWKNEDDSINTTKSYFGRFESQLHVIIMI